MPKINAIGILIQCENNKVLLIVNWKYRRKARVVAAKRE